jgi:hypothetical protein
VQSVAESEKVLNIKEAQLWKITRFMWRFRYW